MTRVHHRATDGSLDRAGSSDRQRRSDDRLDNLHVAIPADKLVELLSRQALCAADLRCLDCTSRRWLRELCLEACARSLQASTVSAGAPASQQEEHPDE